MDTMENTPRKRSSCCLIVALCAVVPAIAVVLLVGWSFLIHWVIPAPALVISEETTRITGPLTAEGYIDFFRALEQRIDPPELATDDNGYRVFVRIFGDVRFPVREISDEDREFYRLLKYEKLGLDPDVPPTLAFPTAPDTVLHDYYNAKGVEEWWRTLVNPHSIDWNVIYRRINEAFDAIQEPSPRAKLASIMEEIERSRGWQGLLDLLTPGGQNTFIANQFVGLLNLHVANEIMVRYRFGCTENMQRLALAILLYQLEHDEMPGADWAVQIKKYLGGNALDGGAEHFFSCPANPSPAGMTTYALVQYGDKLPPNPDTILLIELPEPVPFAEAMITVDEVLPLVGSRTVEIVEVECCGRTFTRERVTVIESRLTAHPGGANIAYRSGAVRFLPRTIAEEELLRMLGRDGERGNEE